MSVDLALMAIVLVVGVAGALRPLSWAPRPTWRVAAPLAAGIAALMLSASLPAAHGAHPASLHGLGLELFGRASACFAFGTAFGCITWIVLRVFDRQKGLGRRLQGGGLGAAAGAGLAGSIALYLHCPITHPQHLWAGHVTVMLPFVLLGLLTRHRG